MAEAKVAGATSSSRVAAPIWLCSTKQWRKKTKQKRSISHKTRTDNTNLETTNDAVAADYKILFPTYGGGFLKTDAMLPSMAFTSTNLVHSVFVAWVTTQ